MRDGQETDPLRRTYFVDEAGDGNLFGRRGKVIVGTEGCSRYFILGVRDVAAPQSLSDALEQLRAGLLADPYFAGVPSLQPEARKTALAFHAKDDLPEVRREVFRLLAAWPLRFFACVKDKKMLVEYVRQRNQVDCEERYNPNGLYDFMVWRLFETLLHKDAEYLVYFARRGKSDRTAALRLALESSRRRFCRKHGIPVNSVVQVRPCQANEHPCLQAADYFLWALQRLYERGEERYVRLWWPSFRLVMDLDDQSERAYGTYYTQKKPLTIAASEERPRI